MPVLFLTSTGSDKIQIHLYSSYPVHNIDTGLNYTTIQDAIDAIETLNGHTIFVEQGRYTSVVVDKSLTLIGESMVNTIIDGIGINRIHKSMTIQNTSNVYITGFTFLNGYDCGIGIEDSKGVALYANLLRHNFYDGIRVIRSTNVTIANNDVTGNFDWGIRVFDSDSINIMGNNASNNGYGVGLNGALYCDLTDNLVANNREIGVSLFYSRNTVFRNNSLLNNVNDLEVAGFHGYPPSDYEQDIDNSNMLNGKPMYYWVLKRSQEIPSDAGYVALIDCERIIVRDLTLTNQTNGIFLVCTTWSKIENVTVSNNDCGIRFQDCYFYVFVEGQNTICNNTIVNNRSGVILSNSGDNTFYHNNFIGNGIDVLASGNPSIWDNGYPLGGNYWSDYQPKYPNATEVDDSGIWDTPYVIDANNIDHYPLIAPVIVPEIPSFFILLLFMTLTLLTAAVFRRRLCGGSGPDMFIDER
jgi:parallel beta-helix repeat protein